MCLIYSVNSRDYGFNFRIAIHHFAKFSIHRSWSSNDTAAKTVYMILQDHVTKVSSDSVEVKSSLYIPHLAKIDSHRHCVNGYITILVCHMILQDHVFIWSCDFMGKSHSK